MSTFVTVGNGRQPFDRLLHAVAKAQDLLPQPVCVQCGSTSFNHPKWDVREFIDMHDFERLIRQSTVLIMHGGAGSIISACRAGKCPVVMPRLARYGEIIDDHQLEFAEALARRGSVLLARDPLELPSAIERARTGTSGRPVGDEPPLVANIARLLAAINEGAK